MKKSIRLACIVALITTLNGCLFPPPFGGPGGGHGGHGAAPGGLHYGEQRTPGVQDHP